MKPNWDLLLNQSSLASVLPPKYAHFARPIRDGLTVFLERLPAADQAKILLEQATLPLTSTISQRLGLLARRSPVLHKLGQILARDRRLSPELRSQLRQLESLPPTTGLDDIRAVLEQQLGGLKACGITLTPPAIAEASVAVVIPFRRSTSSRDDRQRFHGVLKILKPGIDERLEQELELLQRVGVHLDDRCDELRLPHLDYQESFQRVREKLLDEVTLEHEQRHLVQSRAFYANDTRVRIPRLLDPCTPRVTAMERISGGKITAQRADCRYSHRQIAHLVAKSLIAKPIFSRDDRVLFHGDPHAGNLFLTEDDRLAILDWSLVGQLSQRQRVAIVQLIIGAITLDDQYVTSVLEQLSDRERLRDAALRGVVGNWLAKIRRGQFPGLCWLIGMLDDATQNARLRVGADMMLFRKSLHTLEGVIADLGQPIGIIDNVLCAEFVRHFTREWPERWLRDPHFHDFPTRLSNFDLTRTILSSPATATRFWTGHAMDLLNASFGQRASKSGTSVTSADGGGTKYASTRSKTRLENSCP